VSVVARIEGLYDYVGFRYIYVQIYTDILGSNWILVGLQCQKISENITTCTRTSRKSEKWQVCVTYIVEYMVGIYVTRI